MLELLRDISGIFRPGTLSCLMVSASLAVHGATLVLMISPAALAPCSGVTVDTGPQCNVLQGVSGAGRTTLMDVLSGRLPGILKKS